MFFEKEIKSLEFQLKESLGRELEEYMEKVSGYGLGLGLAAGAITLALKGFFYGSVTALACFMLAVAAGAMHPIYLYGKKTREIDATVPDLLLQASLFPPRTPITRILGYLSKAGYPLSREFSKALKEIKNGSSVPEALENIRHRVKSKSVERTVKLLVQGYESGADISKVFKETASDLLKTQNVLRERNLTLAIQKYTLLLSAAILLPLILGMLGGLSKDMSFAGLEEYGLGTTKAEQESYTSTSLAGNQFYLVEYSIIVAAFIGLIENDYRKGMLYSIALIPCTLIVYSLA